ncbi:MAG: 2'-5' RNA ligase family protein [Cyclobacteriaceae bacterium]
MSEGLYFIAIVPPQEIQDEITGLKQLVADKFGSNHALRSPPHITLHMPFKWKDRKKDQLIDVIERINDSMVPFEIDLKDFGFFEPRVVFVNVVENQSLIHLQKEVVELCRKELKLDNANYRDQLFHPHVTIGFRDLKKRMFYEARKHFEEQALSCRFQAERVSLLKHDGERWGVEPGFFSG